MCQIILKSMHKCTSYGPDKSGWMDAQRTTHTHRTECVTTISCSSRVGLTKMKIVELVNRVDPDEVAYNEPPHHDLHCLPSSLSILDMIYIWMKHFFYNFAGHVFDILRVNTVASICKHNSESDGSFLILRALDERGC